MPDNDTAPAEVTALRARIATLEEAAAGNKSHVQWLSDLYNEHGIALHARDGEISRLRDLNNDARTALEEHRATIDRLRVVRDGLLDDNARMRDLIGRIHHFGTIPDALRAEANNWIPDEWSTKTKMTEQAQATIHAAGVTIAGYVREQGYENGWGGDRCGCPDDRCIGFHHLDETDCGCLPALLDQYVKRMADTT